VITTRRIVIGLAVLGVLAILGGLGAWWGYSFVKQRRQMERFERAEELFEKGDYLLAKRHYGTYLRHAQEDVDTLRKYAYASLQVVANRKESLGDASMAYHQLWKLEPLDPEAQGFLLDIYERAESWSELEYFVRQILKFDPENERAEYYRGFALEHENRPEEAAEVYEGLIGRGTTFPEAYTNLAGILVRRGHEARAEDVLADMLASHAEDGRFRLARAEYFLKAGDAEQGEEELAKARELLPDDADILLAEVRLATLRDDWTEARTLAQRVTELAPDRPEGYIHLARTWEAEGNHGAAIEVMKGVAPLVCADHPEILMALADMQYSAETLEDARATVDQYRLYHPNRLLLFQYFEGRDLLAQGRLDEAAEKLQRVVDRAPGFGPAEYYLAVTYLRLNQMDEARSLLEAHVVRFPNAEHARQLLLAQQVEPLGTLDDAENMATGLLRDEKNSAQAYVAAASAYLATMDELGVSDSGYGRIVELYERAIEEGPDEAPAYIGLARLRLRQDDPDGAQAVLDRAASAGVTEPSLAMTHARIRLARSDVAGARSIFESDTASDEITADRFVAWAEFFGVRGETALAQEVCRLGLARFNGESRTQIAIAQAVLTAESEGVAEGRAALDAIAVEVPADSFLVPRLNRARLAMARRLIADTEDTVQAKEILDQVRTLDPDNEDARLLEAGILLSTEPPDLDAADVLLSPLAEAGSDNAELLFMLSRVAAEKGDRQRGMDLAERGVEAAPYSKGLLLHLGWLQLNEQLYTNAQITFRRVLNIDPSNADAHRFLVSTHLASGKADDAHAALERFEAVAADNPDLGPTLGSLRSQVLLLRGESSEAEGVLRARLEDNPDDFEAVRDLATALRRLRRLDEAEALITDYANRNTESADAWVLLARFYMAHGGDARLGGASTAITRALMVDPNHGAALRAMIELNLRQNRAAEALALCDRYLERHPNDAELLYRKAQILEFMGIRLDEALAAADGAVAQLNRPQYVALRGILRLEAGNCAGARDDLLAAGESLTITPGRIDLSLARAYLCLEEFESSQFYLERAQRKAEEGDRVNGAELSAIAAQMEEEKAST
jgi:predicted Zn-dependent protease